MTEKFLLESPAKLNLFLNIIDRKPCGYYIIETLMVFTSFSDLVEVEIGDFTDSVHFEGRNINMPDENTVTKALKYLKAAKDIKEGVCVKVTKNIPTAAGLGGPSGNAAVVLELLGKRWGFDNNIINRIAKSIGADVWPSIVGKPLIQHNESVTLVQDIFLCPHVVLANLGKPVSTVEAFNRYNDEMHPRLPPLPTSGDEILHYLNHISTNVLCDAAEEISPGTKSLIKTIKKQKGCVYAGMSGSGGTCFGIFETQLLAESALNRIKYVCKWCVCTKIKDVKEPEFG